MEELKLLVEMVAGLPTMTVWVLAGYLAYKLAIVGSIYGVIRLAINKLYEYKARPREMIHKVSSKTINEDVLYELQGQVARIGTSVYIHSSDVNKLRKAIDLIEKGEIK